MTIKAWSFHIYVMWLYKICETVSTYLEEYRVAEQGKASTDENCDNDCGSACGIQLTERQREILVLLQNDGTKVAGVIAGVIGTSKRTIEKELSFLRKNGFIKKATKDNRSPWIVLKK